MSGNAEPGSTHGFVGNVWHEGNSEHWATCQDCKGEFDPGEWAYPFSGGSRCDECCNIWRARGEALKRAQRDTCMLCGAKHQHPSHCPHRQSSS